MPNENDIPPDKIIGATSNGAIDLWQGFRKFKLEYLERIPDTPFATKKVVELEGDLQFVKNGEYDSYSVESMPIKVFLDILQLESFGVLQSFVKEFQYIAEKSTRSLPYFKAVYYDTFYLNSKTADGCFDNFYIGCNRSFKEFFDSEAKLAVYTEDKEGNVSKSNVNLVTDKDIEVFANMLYSKYPVQLGKYSLDEIYGYWGFVPVPKSNTFNGFFNEVGGGTFKSEGLVTFSTQQSIGKQAFKVMQEQYKMSSFLKLLNGIGHLFSSTSEYIIWCYMIYVDGGSTELLITQNGSSSLESTQGAGMNGIVDGLQSIDWGSGFTKVFAVILALVFGVLSIVVVVKFVRRKR